MGRAFVVNAGWPAGQNDAVRLELCDLGCGNIEPYDFRINLKLANTTRNHLRVLRAEIENQDPRMRRGFHFGGYSGGVCDAADAPVGLLVASFSGARPYPVIPRLSWLVTSSGVLCSSGSAHPPEISAMTNAHKIDKGFIRSF